MKKTAFCLCWVWSISAIALILLIPVLNLMVQPRSPTFKPETVGNPAAIRREMPNGFILVSNVFGEYAAKYDTNGGYIFSPARYGLPTTKEGAIEAAWTQYTFETNLEAHSDWKEVKK